jgi:hypothetical protein
VQTWSELEVPVVLTKEPAPHVVKAVQAGVLAAVENVPAGQIAHVRSACVLPGDRAYSPAAQSVNALHAVAFTSAEYVPPGHAAHVRSVVGVPLALTYSPATQDVHSTHAVIALPSLSNVPLPQGSPAS